MFLETILAVIVVLEVKPPDKGDARTDQTVFAEFNSFKFLALIIAYRSICSYCTVLNSGIRLTIVFGEITNLKFDASQLI